MTGAQAAEQVRDRERLATIIVRRGLYPALREACEPFYVSLEDVLGGKRYKAVAAARRACMAVLRDQPFAFSYPEIGALLGRDHSTVIFGIRKRNEELRAARLRVPATESRAT